MVLTELERRVFYDEARKAQDAAAAALRGGGGRG